MRYKIIYMGSQVANFSGNSCAQKINKAQTKQAYMAGVHYFCGIWHQLCFLLSIIYPLPQNFLQIPFSPCTSGRDTGSVAVIAITPPFRR